MHFRSFFMFLFLCFLSCHNTKQDDIKPEKFDKTKWATNNEEEYPYRDLMLTDLIEHQKLKGLKKQEALDLLGEPNKTDNGYLFYTIARQHLGNTPFLLHTKTLVLKLNADSAVEWRKIHE